MVTQVLSLTRSGLSDFVVQRVTAVILTLYTFVVVGFFILNDVNHVSLVAFFGSFPMKMASVLAIFATVGHAWVGLWTIGTDYLRPAHVGSMATVIRFGYQVLCLLAMFAYLVWGINLILNL